MQSAAVVLAGERHAGERWTPGWTEEPQIALARRREGQYPIFLTEQSYRMIDTPPPCIKNTGIIYKCWDNVYHEVDY
jgi:hypothetical protein